MDNEQTLAAAEAFEQMAAKLRHNRHEPFAGAFVIVPPPGEDGALEPTTMYLIDNKAAAAVFWATMKTRVDIALRELDDQNPMRGMR